MWMAVEWYLVRTKAGEERRVNEHLTGFADETLLPLIKVRVRRWGNLIESIAHYLLTACSRCAVRKVMIARHKKSSAAWFANTAHRTATCLHGKPQPKQSLWCSLPHLPNSASTIIARLFLTTHYAELCCS
jgi:hypothetical protein